jgi:hypothetical protein
MRGFILILLVLAVTGSAAAQTEITRWVLASAGGSAATPTLTLAFTLGEPVVGDGSSGDVGLRSGYWGTAGAASAIEDLPGSLPLAFALHRPAPNPFSTATTIRFDVPARGGPVAIKVFDIVGRQVRALFSGTPGAGRHETMWDGRSESGVRLDSGAYFVVFQARGVQREAKLILLR